MMNGLPGNSLHTANTCNRTPIKKIHHLCPLYWICWFCVWR